VTDEQHPGGGQTELHSVKDRLEIVDIIGDVAAWRREEGGTEEVTRDQLGVFSPKRRSNCSFSLQERVQKSSCVWMEMCGLRSMFLYVRWVDHGDEKDKTDLKIPQTRFLLCAIHIPS
jgi:hypothetical protein